MSGAYSLYVNLTATTTGLTGGLRSGATQLRAFDGQLTQVNRTLLETGDAATRLAMLQNSATVDMLRNQAQITAAVERSRLAWLNAGAAADKTNRAEVLSARLATKAETERAAAVTAGEQALRAQALAQTMAARAQATAGAGVQAAQATAAAAAAAATRAAQAQVAQEERAAAAQATATRAATLAQRAALGQQVAETQATQASMAQADVEAAASTRAVSNAAAVRQAQAAADAETRAATQARIDGYLRTGLVLSAVLGAGIAEAVSLEKRMANVMTISRQINAGTVGGYTDQIVKMSEDVTQSADQLADGLYQIVSSGFDGADAMEILRVSATGASAGLTTTDIAARALLGVLKSYGLGASSASDVMDIMFQTVNKGVISFQELAQQLGDVVPMAAASGVAFSDVSSALAAITLAGVPAAESSTALNMLLTRLMKPTDSLASALKSMGYESGAAALQQDGLYVVVNKLIGATHGSADAIVNMFGDIRASRAVLALAAADGQNYADSYEAISNEVERAGATQRAFALQMDTTSGQWQQFVNRSKALGIDLGRALLPVVETIGNALSVFAGSLNDLPSPVKDIGAALLALSVAGLIARATISKVGLQLTEFREALTAARAGASMFPAVLKGAGLAVSGLSALLTVGVAVYAAYSASKEKAKQATDDLVEALRQEREEGESGAGVRALTEQLTGDQDFVDKMKAAGIDMTDAVDIVTSGGSKLQAAQLKLESEGAAMAQKAKVGQATASQAFAYDDAEKALDDAHNRWTTAVKKESDLAAQMEIVNAKVAEAKAGAVKAWTLDYLVPVDKDGMPAYTDEMKAMGKALGDIVDPAKAWTDAQDKVAKSNKNAKATLADYIAQLRSQLQSQRNFQRNLTALAMSGYADLTDHFAQLGVTSAPILDELVKQLGKGQTKVADQLQSIIGESAARSSDAFRAGLDQLPAIAAQYGKKIAAAWADAAQTNDADKFAVVMQQMAVTDMTKAVNAGSAAAKGQLQQGMGLLTQVAQTKGADAAKALKQAFLSGDVTTAMDQLKSIWGADVPVSDKELAQITAAFKTAGKNGVDQWSGMLDLIATVAKTKGTAAAQALTSALLSGDMAQVQKQLAAIGASVREIPGSKTISVSVSTTLVGPKSFTIPVYTKIVKTTWDKDGNGIPDDIQAPSTQARGSVLDFYAAGGLRKPGAEQHVAQIAPAGAWRVWAEPETDGEGYIPLAASKRTRSKAILAEVARRFGASVVYHADGGMSGWQYQPSSSVDGPVSLPSIASDSMNKAGTAVDLAKFAKNLRASVAQAKQWRKDLATVARRCGQDVADALQDMGADGVSLTHKMATGTTTYVKQMASELESLAATAKATLSDYTAQLGSAAKQTAAFQANLAKLAGEGYGDLAARLAAQGDDAAQQLAAQAAASKTAAAKANSASKAASATLSSDDLSDLLTIIAAVTSNKVGIHAVADATGLGEDRIIEVANAGLSRLKKALGSRSTKLVADLGRANKGLSYSSGGVLTPGLYATSNGIVRFAEPETDGEAFIPLGSAKRSTATAVLEDVAQRFGYQLTASGVSGPTRLVDARPAGGVHVVVVREQPAALIGQMPVTVNGGGGADTAQQVGGEVMRQLRRAQRGGRI